MIFRRRSKVGSLAGHAIIAWMIVGATTGRDAAAQEAAGAAAPVCIAGQDTPRLLRLRGGAVEQCLELDPVTCYATNLRSGRLSRLPGQPPSNDPLPRFAPDGDEPKLTIGDDTVEVCRANGSACKTLKARGEVDPGLGLGAAANPAGTKAVLSYLDGGTVVETFDVASGKPLGRFTGRSAHSACVNAEFVGATLLVREQECGGATKLTWLATPAGKRIAEVGGKKGMTVAYQPAHLEGERWAFASAAGDTVVVQDVATGKVERRLALGRGPTGAGKDATVSLIGDGHTLVVVHQGARQGELAVIDVGTWKVTKHRAARCK
jgi:hypothetical protein